MEGDFIKIREWLLPVSWLYGLGVRFRNQLFEMGVLKSRSFNIPVISVATRKPASSKRNALQT